MKHLKIEYNNGRESIVLWDAEVDEVQWSDGPNGVAVAGKVRKSSTSAGAGAFLEKLVGATKAQTGAIAEAKRDEYLAEDTTRIVGD